MSVKSLTKANGFSPALSDFFEPWSEWFQNGFAGKSLTIPAANITTTDKEYKLSLAAPGFSKADFKIKIDGGILAISAEKEKQSEKKDDAYTRKEYNYSSFSRCFTLPAEINEEKMEAIYKDGILNLTIPKNGKAVHAKAKSIQIK